MESNLLTAINELIDGYFSYVSENFFDNEDIHDIDLDAINDLVDYYINNENEDFLNENLCLLSLEYYNIMCNITGVDYFSDDDDVIDNMKELNKNNYINFLLEDTDSISNIFIEIINEYIDDYPLIEYQYMNIDDIIKNENSFEIYKKLHPYLSNELQNYKGYIFENNILSDIYDKNIHSLIELLNTTIIAASVLDENELIDLIYAKIWFIKLTDEKLYKEVILFLSKYFYICAKKRIEQYGNLSIGEVSAFEFLMESDIDEIVNKAPEYILINNFLNFNFLSYIEEEKSLDEESKKFIKKFN